MNPDETDREWDAGQWAGEESTTQGEQGHWNRREWVGDQTADDTTLGGEVPADESIPREDIARDRPGGPSGMGHNPERAHWADTGGDR